MNVSSLPTEHQRALYSEINSKESLHFGLNLNLESLVFVEGGKLEISEKTPQSNNKLGLKPKPHLICH